MLYLIGLGLPGEKDITVKGLEIVRRASRVYLEAYTAILLVDEGRARESLESCRSWSLSSVDETVTKFRSLTWYCFAAVGNILWPICHPRRPRNGRVA